MKTMTVSHAERARAYVAAMPGVVQGQGGDERTYKACCVLVNDFGLSEVEAWPILLEWNGRCVPPWPESDLRSKLASAVRCRHPNPKGSKLGAISQRCASPTFKMPPPSSDRPNRDGFNPGTPDQLRRLAASRPYGLDGLDGLRWATERSALVFGKWGAFEVYGVTDSSGKLLEIRRVDGELFPALNDLKERKSHAIRHSQKSWPLGILEAKAYPTIALVEGIPDFLEAHDLALWEQASHHQLRDVHCAPVGMLSASPTINADALPHFRGKIVVIFQHRDDAGEKAARKWAGQLYGIAAKIEIFKFDGLQRVNGEPACDLFDCRDLDPRDYSNDETLWRLLP